MEGQASSGASSASSSASANSSSAAARRRNQLLTPASANNSGAHSLHSPGHGHSHGSHHDVKNPYSSRASRSSLIVLANKILFATGFIFFVSDTVNSPSSRGGGDSGRPSEHVVGMSTASKAGSSSVIAPDDVLPSSHSEKKDLATFRKSSSAAVFTEGIPEDICLSNPYLKYVDDRFADVAAKADQWLTSSPSEHRVRAADSTGEFGMNDRNTARFFPFEKLTSCSVIDCVGGRCNDDESKTICGLPLIQEKVDKKEKCLVYVFGTANRWIFERDFLLKKAKKGCVIHVFDCMGPKSRFEPGPRIPNDLTPYFLHHHHICLGPVHVAAPPRHCKDGMTDLDRCGPIVTLPMIQQGLGHEEVDLVIMNMKGLEWSVLNSWPTLDGEGDFSPEKASDFMLPHQLIVDFNYETPYPALWKANHRNEEFVFASDVVVTQEQLLRMGYVPVHRRDSSTEHYSTTVTFLRLKCPSKGLYEHRPKVVTLSESNKEAEEDSGDLGSRKPADTKLCGNQSPYLKSMDESGFDVVEQKVMQWLKDMPSQLQRAQEEKSLWEFDQTRYFPFEKPHITCSDLVSVGNSNKGYELGKMTCGTKYFSNIRTQQEKKIGSARSSGPPACVVYVAGTTNQWQFEKAILFLTPCEVHIFSCKGHIAKFNNVPGNSRLHFHHVCLGAEHAPAPEVPCTRAATKLDVCGEVMTLPEIQRTLGHRRIDLMKIDLEGHEWEVLKSWPNLNDPASGDFVLPHQLLLQVHYRTRNEQLWGSNHKGEEFKFPPDVVHLQKHLVEMGYATAHISHSKRCLHCTDVTLIRYRCPSNGVEADLSPIDFTVQVRPPPAAGANMADVFQGPGEICVQNPYVHALNASFDVVASKADEWLESSMGHQFQRAQDDRKVWEFSHARYFPFDPLSSCVNMTCIGGKCGGDTSKTFCGLEHLDMDDGCIIYSIRTNNMWNFEKELLKYTPCTVHTFDCTGHESRFKVPRNERIKFHHICLGSEYQPPPEVPCGVNATKADICGSIKTLGDIQKELGHNQIDLLKMDMEGFEWPIFNSWPTLDDNAASEEILLPMQISVELHFRTKHETLWDDRHKGEEFVFPPDVVKMQERLLRMGYMAIVRDDNTQCKHCTELTLMRFRCPRLGVYGTLPHHEEFGDSLRTAPNANAIREAKKAAQREQMEKAAAAGAAAIAAVGAAKKVEEVNAALKPGK